MQKPHWIIKIESLDEGASEPFKNLVVEDGYLVLDLRLAIFLDAGMKAVDSMVVSNGLFFMKDRDSLTFQGDLVLGGHSHQIEVSHNVHAAPGNALFTGQIRHVHNGPQDESHNGIFHGDP